MTHFSPIPPRNLFTTSTPASQSRLNFHDSSLLSPVAKLSPRSFHDDFYGDVDVAERRESTFVPLSGASLIATPKRVHPAVTQPKTPLRTPSKALHEPLSSPQYIDELIIEKVSYSKEYIHDQLVGYLNVLDDVIERRKTTLMRREVELQDKRRELDMLRHLVRERINVWDE